MITLTDAAVEHIKKMLAATANSKGFRLSIKKTGCSGFSYVPEIIDSVQEKDFHCVQENINIYLDSAYQDLLMDLKIDFAQENPHGIKQKRLIFMNNKETGRCGCGESFTVD